MAYRESRYFKGISGGLEGVIGIPDISIQFHEKFEEN